MLREKEAGMPEQGSGVLREERKGFLRKELPEMHRMQGDLPQDQLQGLQAQGPMQEEL
jgi:hypothetical protein